MKWMKERDLLIAQTMAFVQSVTGRKPDAELQAPAANPTPAPPIVAAPAVNVEAVLAEPAPNAIPAPKPLQAVSLDLPGDDFQAEIRARVASFRAHQEKFSREREEYCRVTLAKARATFDEGSGE